MNLLDSVYWLGGSFKSTLKWATLTGNQVLVFPNRSGTIATLTPSIAVTVTAVTAIDYAIPSGANRITFMASGVLIPTQSLIRLSTAGVVKTSGYSSTLGYTGTSYGYYSQSTIGFQVPPTIAESSAIMVLDQIATNSWVMSATCQSQADYIFLTAGRVALSGELDLIRFMPPSGNFTAGGIVNIFVE